MGVSMGKLHGMINCGRGMLSVECCLVGVLGSVLLLVSGKFCVLYSEYRYAEPCVQQCCVVRRPLL